MGFKQFDSMNDLPYKSLTIAGKNYSRRELIEFSQQQISNKSITKWETDLYSFILDWTSDKESISIKTSGSTGSSKWMEFEKEKMIKSAQLTGQFFKLQKNNKALLCLPVDFIAGKMMVVRAFELGLNMIPVKPSGNPLNNLNVSFDFAAMIPMQVYNILEDKNGIDKLNQIQNLIIGGGEIYNSLLQKIEKLKNNTYHTYGMTETITHVALKKISGENPDPAFLGLPEIKF